jgi:hypothetical protein
MIDYHITPTVLPCPDWCTLPDGHGFASVDWTGNLWRQHSRDFGAGPGPCAELTMSEVAAGINGPVDPTATPEVGIWVNGADHELTGPQACALAGWLLQAATAWDAARS